jgi:hypothetical protein
MTQLQADFLLLPLSLAFWAGVGYACVVAKRRVWDPAARNAARIRAEAREAMVGPEGSPELGALLDRELAPGAPVLAVFSVTATNELPAWIFRAMVLAALFPPTLLLIVMVVVPAFLLLTPFILAWLFYRQARAVAAAPPGGLGDLLVVQPGRLTVLRGVVCDPKRGVYGVRQVDVLPEASLRAIDLTLVHALEDGHDRRKPHLHVPLGKGGLKLQPFGAELRRLAELPLDRLPPRYRERLRPFPELRRALGAALAGG